MVPLFLLTNIPKQRKGKVKMVSTRFNSFVLELMFIFLALRDSQSVAYTHKAKEKMAMVITDGDAFVAAGETPSILEKENIDAVAVPNAVVEANINGKLGGRKMMEKMVLGKEMVVKEEGIKIGGAPKISGRNINVSKKRLGTSQDHMHQNDARVLKPKPLGSKRLGNSVKESVDLNKTNPLCSQDSSAGRLVCSRRSMPVGFSKGSVDSFQNLQSDKLLNDETTTAPGIVNLMNKDYSGADNPPHKPPVNNYEPLHQPNEIP